MATVASFANVLVDDGAPVRTVTVNRPQVLNALDETTLRELAAAFSTIARDPAVRVVILTGAGDKAFVAGADIAAMRDLGPWQARTLAAAGHELGAIMESGPQPIIAAVNGFALGGGLELALLADFIYASDKAKLGFPEVNLGVIPGFGGTQRLPMRIGIARARELVLTGQIIGAEEALRIGLVNAVVPAADLLPKVRAVADTIASRGPLAVAEARRAMRLGASLPLERAVVVEQELFGGLFATADQKEGMRAFLEKRPAKFEGK